MRGDFGEVGRVEMSQSAVYHFLASSKLRHPMLLDLLLCPVYLVELQYFFLRLRRRLGVNEG